MRSERRESRGHRDGGAVATSGNGTFIGAHLKLEHKGFTGLVFKPVTISEASTMLPEPISFHNACKS